MSICHNPLQFPAEDEEDQFPQYIQFKWSREGIAFLIHVNHPPSMCTQHWSATVLDRTSTEKKAI